MKFSKDPERLKCQNLNKPPKSSQTILSAHRIDRTGEPSCDTSHICLKHSKVLSILISKTQIYHMLAKALKFTTTKTQIRLCNDENMGYNGATSKH